jgi:integral membrane protein
MTVEDRVVQMRAMRRAVLAEGITLLLLVGVAVPLRHLAGIREATQIMGPIHGIAFVACLWLLIEAASSGTLTRAEAMRLLLATTIPFGVIFSHRYLCRKIERETQ